MTEYRQTLALRPDNAPAHNALAGLLEDRGEATAALGQYRQAVALLPTDARLRFNLAGALADAGRRPQAAEQYREALRLKPDFAEAAQALRALGPISPVGAPLAAPVSQKGAMNRALPASSLSPRTPLSHSMGEGPGVGAALALARAGRLPEAIAAFRAVLTHDPRDAAARLHLGIALYADGRTAQARHAWEQVQAQGGKSAAAQARRLLARYR